MHPGFNSGARKLLRIVHKLYKVYSFSSPSHPNKKHFLLKIQKTLWIVTLSRALHPPYKREWLYEQPLGICRAVNRSQVIDKASVWIVRNLSKNCWNSPRHKSAEIGVTLCKAAQKRLFRVFYRSNFVSPVNLVCHS